MSKTVKYEVDLANLPPLMPTQKTELEALATMPDSQIDHTDIPPLTDDFWKQATKNPFYRPTKQATTVRVDADVLLWLKGQGKGYQTRINAILREAMLQSLHPKG
ncbi:MAG: cytoplasmic protein [Pseudomonas sp.]|nr:MAG: cytoplasmic protein [Pseudomonas sp.]